MTPAQIIGARIGARRVELGVSVLDLAEACGVARNTVYAWESGRYAPSLDKWPTLRDALLADWLSLFGPWGE